MVQKINEIATNKRKQQHQWLNEWIFKAEQDVHNLYNEVSDTYMMTSDTLNPLFRAVDSHFLTTRG